ncbi:hypothetical protein DFH09DRAFT_1090777 [Mycena vulgaris]|nr:hypothetical protein DFH09DRAFT_1090777 [Mycena vulgaris]
MAQASSGAQYPGRMVQAQAREALRELQRTPRTRVDAASILRCESDRRTEKERRKSPKSRRRKERTRGKRPPITRIHISIAYRSLGGGGPWLRPAELRTYEVLQHIPSLRSGVDSSVSFGRVFMLAGSTIESSKKGAQQDEAAQHHSSPFGDHPLLWGAYVPDLSEMPRDHGGGRLPTAPRITIAAMQNDWFATRVTTARAERSMPKAGAEELCPTRPVPAADKISAARMIGDYPTFAEGPVPNADDNTQSKDIPADPLLARRLEKRRRLEFGGHSQLQFSWIKSLAPPRGTTWKGTFGHSYEGLMEHRSAKELEVQRKADPEDVGEDGVGMRSCDDLDDAEKPGIVDSCPRSADPEDFGAAFMTDGIVDEKGCPRSCQIYPLFWSNTLQPCTGEMRYMRHEAAVYSVCSPPSSTCSAHNSWCVGWVGNGEVTGHCEVEVKNGHASHRRIRRWLHNTTTYGAIAQQTVEDSRHMTAASTTGEDTLNQPKPEIVPESRNLSSDTRKTQCLDAVPAVFSRRDVRGTK